MWKLRLLEPCLWLAVDVAFERGTVSGPDASELWRAVIKDGLVSQNPEQAISLLEPMRAKYTQGQRSNVDCAGLVLECRDQERGARLFLKFLGQAYRFGPACLLALEHGLRSGVGRQRAKGSVVRLQAWQDARWIDIAMPLRGSDLERWRADPALLAGFDSTAHPVSLRPGIEVDTSRAPANGKLRLKTRTRWLWRQQGKAVTRPPELVDVLTLVAQRVARFAEVWGQVDRTVWEPSLQSALYEAREAKRSQHEWRNVRRRVGGLYPSHGKVGHLVFEGHFSAGLMYWLYAGSFLHVGQQTAIGLGGYFLAFE